MAKSRPKEFKHQLFDDNGLLEKIFKYVREGGTITQNKKTVIYILIHTLYEQPIK